MKERKAFTAKNLILIIVMILLIFGVCANIYASNHGYGNIFTMTKKMISGEEQIISENEKTMNIPNEGKTQDASNNAYGYYDNLINSENGKIAFEKWFDGQKNGSNEDYITFTDGFNDTYYIKEVKNVVSEKGVLGNGGDALFKVTVTYVDKENQTKDVEFALILTADYNMEIPGSYLKFTGSTRFVRSYTDIYDDGIKNSNVDDLIGLYSLKSETKDSYYNSNIRVKNQSDSSIEFTIDTLHGRDEEHVNIGKLEGIAYKKDGKIYEFSEEIDGKTYKITFDFSGHRSFKYVSVTEAYPDNINPYGGHGVYFAGDYEYIGE